MKDQLWCFIRLNPASLPSLTVICLQGHWFNLHALSFIHFNLICLPDIIPLFACMAAGRGELPCSPEAYLRGISLTAGGPVSPFVGRTLPRSKLHCFIHPTAPHF